MLCGEKDLDYVTGYKYLEIWLNEQSWKLIKLYPNWQVSR